MSVWNLPDRLLDLIERLVQADPNQRFQTPADALAFLDAAQTQELAPGAPQAGPAGAFGPDIGELVAREERDEQDRKRREMQRAERELAKRASRVKVDARDDEILLEVKRKTSWLIPVPIIAFLIVNPGVFVVQEFFLGSWWPVFTENVLARWLVWGLFVLATVVGVFKLLTPPLRVRLTRDGHFMKYGWSPNRPQTVGKFERINVALHAETNGVDPDTAALLLRDSDGETVLAERFANLSVADARAIDSVARWEGFGDPEVVLYNRESEEQAAATSVEARRG